MLLQLMRSNPATRALTRSFPRWRSDRVRRGYGSRICRRVARACRPTEVRRFQAAAASLVIAKHTPAYGPGEKGTLQVGSWIVLGTLALGVEFGRWPAWTALAAAAGYMVWVIAYSEATVQARRRWPQNRRLALSPAGSEQPTAAPPKERRTA